MSEPKVHKIGDLWSEADKLLAELEESHKMEVEQLLMEITEKDAEIARLNDKLRHYPMMAALIESGNKEIAELKDRLQAADKQIENLINGASSIMLAQDRVTDNKCAELRHQKYKRCLAMALLALEKRETYRAEYEEWCLKWFKRWLELAEKFKETRHE